MTVTKVTQLSNTFNGSTSLEASRTSCLPVHYHIDFPNVLPLDSVQLLSKDILRCFKI